MDNVVDQGKPPAEVISVRRLNWLHRRARRQRANKLWLQKLVKIFLFPIIRLCWRPVIEIRQPLSKEAILVAANHRSSLDPLIQAYALKTPLRWMATSDMFTSLPRAWVLSSLGAFPVQRGKSDEQSLETAKILLLAGEKVCIFPEGRLVKPKTIKHRKRLFMRVTRTKIFEDENIETVIGNPKHGIGKLSAETNTPVVPMAIVGMEQPGRAIWRRGAEVRAVVLEEHPPVSGDITPAQAVNDGLWPKVKDGVAMLEVDKRKALAAGASLGLAGIIIGILKLINKR